MSKIQTYPKGETMRTLNIASVTATVDHLTATRDRMDAAGYSHHDILVVGMQTCNVYMHEGEFYVVRHSDDVVIIRDASPTIAACVAHGMDAH